MHPMEFEGYSSQKQYVTLDHWAKNTELTSIHYYLDLP
jgi:hypothetical protein